MIETVLIPIKRYKTSHERLKTCGGCSFYIFSRSSLGSGKCYPLKAKIVDLNPHENCPLWAKDAQVVEGM